MLSYERSLCHVEQTCIVLLCKRFCAYLSSYPYSLRGKEAPFLPLALARGVIGSKLQRKAQRDRGDLEGSSFSWTYLPKTTFKTSAIMGVSVDTHAQYACAAAAAGWPRLELPVRCRHGRRMDARQGRKDGGTGSRALLTSLDAHACTGWTARRSAILHWLAASLLCSGHGSIMAALARSSAAASPANTTWTRFAGPS